MKYKKAMHSTFSCCPQLANNLTSDAFVESIRERITEDRTHDTMYYEPEFAVEDDHGTTHVSLSGPDGSVISFTASINLA